MKTVISNRIYIDFPTEEVKQWIDKYLIITNPTYLKLKKLGKDDEIMRCHVPEKMKLYVKAGNQYIVPKGCLYGLWQYLKQDEVQTNFAKPHFIDTTHFYTNTPISLYDYQERAVEAMLGAKSGILKAGAGSGKTECCVAMIKSIGQRTLCLVHTHDLLNQMKARFLKYYPKLKIGTITSGKVEFGEDITIATWQTMKSIDKELYKDYFNVIVVDEAHHLVQDPTKFREYGGIIENCNARYTFGLTATPFRADTLTPSMYAILGLNPDGEFKPVIEISRDDCNVLTAEHLEVSTRTPTSYDYLDTEGKFVYNELINYLSTNEKRNDLIVDNIYEMNDVETKTYMFAKHKEGLKRKQIVLCSRVEQARTICDKINERGALRAKFITGSVSDKKRREVLEDKEGLNWDVIVSTYALANEGLDVPILSVLHLATPQKDKKTIIQSVGRIERVKDGKPQPYILDYVDNAISYCKRAYSTRKSTIKNRD